MLSARAAAHVHGCCGGERGARTHMPAGVVAAAVRRQGALLGAGGRRGRKAAVALLAAVGCVQPPISPSQLETLRWGRQRQSHASSAVSRQQLRGGLRCGPSGCLTGLTRVLGGRPPNVWICTARNQPQQLGIFLSGRAWLPINARARAPRVVVKAGDVKVAGV